MSAQSSLTETDLLRIIATPFRAYAIDTLPLNDFVFLVSFDYAFCPPSVARQLVTVAIERGYLRQDGDTVHVQFEVFGIEFPLGWKPPTTVRFGDAAQVPLTPLRDVPEYKPIPVKRFKRVQFVTVLFLKAFPKFIGVDEEFYGPFKQGDQAKIPEPNTQLLLKRKFAVLERKPPKEAAPSPKKKAPKKVAKKKSVPKRKQARTLDSFFK